MNRVLVDDSFRSKLGEFHTQTEFCDRHGNVVGYYTPAADYPRNLSDWIRSQISDEELEQRAREPGGLTTEEVLRKLRDLEVG